MTTQTNDAFEQVIRDAGEDWIFKYFASSDETMETLRRTIKSVDDCAKRRFPDGPAITDTVIVDEFQRNPQRIRAFVQAMGAAVSPEMLLMTWRILQGSKVREMSMSYEAEREFCLRVKLATSGRKTLEEYVSHDISDAALLRHFGKMKINDKPLFDGFFALRIK